MGSAGMAAIIGHLAFWVLLIVGFASGVRPRSARHDRSESQQHQDTKISENPRKSAIRQIHSSQPDIPLENHQHEHDIEDGNERREQHLA